ncbi:hypothetical protein LguiA_013371 [Lonicera macranthoides]
MKTRAQRKKGVTNVLPLHKQKKLSKAAKREANALSRLSKPNSTTARHDPDEYQWQLLLADQKKRENVDNANVSLQIPIEKGEIEADTSDAPSKTWKVRDLAGFVPPNQQHVQLQFWQFQCTTGSYALATAVPIFAAIVLAIEQDLDDGKHCGKRRKTERIEVGREEATDGSAIEKGKSSKKSDVKNIRGDNTHRRGFGGGVQQEQPESVGLEAFLSVRYSSGRGRMQWSRAAEIGMASSILERGNGYFGYDSLSGSSCDRVMKWDWNVAGGGRGELIGKKS